MKKNITQEELKSLLHYEPVTGEFTWKVSRGKGKAGSFAGTPHSRGYVHIKISGKLYLAHRLAFLFMTGELPPAEVDHVNGVKTENRWLNLRQATRTENQCNHRLRSNNSSGVKGVSWDKRRGKWQARVCIHGRDKHIGYFHDIEEADVAVQAARIALHGEFVNHGNCKC